MKVKTVFNTFSIIDYTGERVYFYMEEVDGGYDFFQDHATAYPGIKGKTKLEACQNVVDTLGQPIFDLKRYYDKEAA